MPPVIARMALAVLGVLRRPVHASVHGAVSVGGRDLASRSGALGGLNFRAALSFRLVGGRLSGPGDLGPHRGVRSGRDLGVRLRAGRLGAMSLGQYPSCPLVQFEALAQ